MSGLGKRPAETFGLKEPPAAVRNVSAIRRTRQAPQKCGTPATEVWSAAKHGRKWWARQDCQPRTKSAGKPGFFPQVANASVPHECTILKQIRVRVPLPTYSPRKTSVGRSWLSSRWYWFANTYRRRPRSFSNMRVRTTIRR